MLSILTFNVFTGSPLPWIRNGSFALYGSARLSEQLAQVAELGADIICLQELHCDGVLDAYRAAFGDTHECVCERRCPGVRARAAGACWWGVRGVHALT